MIFVWRLAKVAEVLLAVANFRLSVWCKSCGWESVSEEDESLAMITIILIRLCILSLSSSVPEPSWCRDAAASSSWVPRLLLWDFWFFFSLILLQPLVFLEKFYFGGIRFVCLMKNAVIKKLCGIFFTLSCHVPLTYGNCSISSGQISW